MIKRIDCTIIDSKTLVEQFQQNRSGRTSKSNRKNKRVFKKNTRPTSESTNSVFGIPEKTFTQKSRSLLGRFAKYFDLNLSPLGLIIDCFV